MQEIIPPGTIIGKLSKTISNETGLRQMPVVAVASHDTASAVAAVPAPGKNFVYISSGTWSLMGIESTLPIINDETLKYNFTNEGGFGKTFLVLKNIMGLWLLQECKKVWEKERAYSYDELIKMAEDSTPFYAIIDPDFPDFLNPDNMCEAIDAFCHKTNQPELKNIGQFVRCILESLALSYFNTLEHIGKLIDYKIEQINIIGGGSKNRLLCQLTADTTGLPVFAGPVEATAIGNILCQIMVSGQVGSLNELRGSVGESFKIDSYKPNKIEGLDRAYDFFNRIKLRQGGYL